MADRDQPRYDPADGPRDRSLRAGDSDRDAVASILQERHLEGRLDPEEFQARLERCMAAKTYAELDVLLADFPRADDGRRGAERAGRSRPRALPLPLPFLPLAVIAAVVIGGHLIWLAVPLFILVVLRPLVLGRGPRPPRGPWACGPRRITRV